MDSECGEYGECGECGERGECGECDKCGEHDGCGECGLFNELEITEESLNITGGYKLII